MLKKNSESWKCSSLKGYSDKSWVDILFLNFIYLISTVELQLLKNRTNCWQKSTNPEEKKRRWYCAFQKAKNESKWTSLRTSENTH